MAGMRGLLGLVAMMPTLGFAQNLFQETFDSLPGVTCDSNVPAGNPFPVNWLRRNVDQGIPDAQVSYVTDAWIVRGDFTGTSSDCKAFATSFYSPVVAANDWMWTPAITLPLSPAADLVWNARNFDTTYLEGYEVRVMPSNLGPPTGGAGVIGNQITASTVIFSTAAEANVETEHRVSLSSYAGQTVYIGFRLTTTDKFILVVDDITVSLATTDVSIAQPAPLSPFTLVPRTLALTAGVGMSAVNGTAIALTNVSAQATLFHNGSPVGSAVTSNVLTTLNGNSTVPLTFPALPAIDAMGSWEVHYDVSANPADGNLANNQATGAATEVTYGTLARHSGAPTGSLGIGAGNGGEIGYQFTIPQAMTVRAIRLTLAEKPAMDNPGWAGLPIQARLRNIAAGQPDAYAGTGIATTMSVPAINSAAEYYLPFASPVTLSAGTYVVTAIEPTGTDATLTLLMHPDRFVSGQVWVNWPGAPGAPAWSNVESFGASFARMPAISLETAVADFADGFENIPPLNGARGEQGKATPIVVDSVSSGARRSSLENLQLHQP